MKKRILLLTLALAIALCGCTGGKTNGESSSTEKKSIVVGIQQDLDSLDPHLVVAAGTREVLFNVFEGLVKPNENGELVPAVASDYKISEDGKTYTFTLRKGVKFHNGKAVTAQDVKYSIERNAGMRDQELLISRFENIESVNVVDDSTVDVVLKEADTELIAYMTVAIIPADYKEQSSKPIGTGPFVFDSYDVDSKFVVKRNDEYWGEKPELEEVTFKIVANTDSVLLDLQAGTIDIYPYLTDDQAKELSAKFNIEVGNTNLVQGVFLNNENEYFRNEKVRMAMCHAIDKEEIRTMVSGGNGTVIGSFMFPGLGKYFNEDVVDNYEYDIEKAKALLKEAGYPNGFEFTISIPNNYQFHISTGEVIVEQLKKVGITANIELIDWNVWLDEIYTGREFEATIIGFDSTLAPNDLMRRFVSDNSKNMCNYVNAKYDKYYKMAVETTDDSKKIEYYKELQKILSDDAASIFIQDPPLLVAVSKKLEGYTFYPVYVQDMSKIKFVD